jgi:hypothetical protein
MEKPPVIIRLCAMNCLSSSEIAGPDQAIQPSEAALRIAGQVDVAAGDFLDGVDRLAQRDNVVGEVAVHATLDLVG